MKKILLSLTALVGFGMLTLEAKSASATQSFAESAKDFLAKAREARAKKAEAGATTETKKSVKAPRRKQPRGTGATDSIRSAIHNHVPKQRSIKEVPAAVKAKMEKAKELRRARLAAAKTASKAA